MIKLEQVGKTYRVGPGPGRQARVIEAVVEATASIPPGGVIGVVGPNGAGKTTLFGLLLGFLEATSGSLTVDGQDARTYVRRNGAAYLPERFQLPRDWTLRSALHALLSLDRSTRNVDELLAEFDLTAYGSAAAHTLSRGTMQRAGLAQAFATPRNLVVLDEPTEGLDPLWRVRFREALQRLRAERRTILVASHDIAEIERIADRVLILKQGRIVDDVTIRRAHDDTRDYTLVLAAAHPAVSTAFQQSQPVSETSYRVTVAGATDLSARLAALLEAGAIVISVQPNVDLEGRITSAPPAELN